MWYGFKPYVTVAQRKAKAAKHIEKLKKKGQTFKPVVLEGRTIARSFWGKAWCDNLEHYSDYANRLPRGRSYVRNGFVLDLEIQPGEVLAMVSGSDIYHVSITVAELEKTRWKNLCADCSSSIDSIVELLSGRLSKSVMERMCNQKTGLFPAPKDIKFTCSCPDWASMCKHVAAVLYGIGARLDEEPGLLFTLRKVNVKDMVTKAGEKLGTETRKKPASSRIISAKDAGDIFGLEITSTEPRPEPLKTIVKTARKKPAKAVKKELPDIKIGKLGFSTRAMSVLKKAGITTIRQVEMASDAELLIIKGMGRKTLQEIRLKADKCSRTVKYE